MSTHQRLAGRRILVIGASSGLGEALAFACAQAGATVAVSARRADRLDDLVQRMGSGFAFAGDATLADDAQRVATQAAKAMGGIDVMVYMAGYGVLQELKDTDVDTWVDVFKLNVIGANLAAAASLDHVGRNGLIAFVSSRTVFDSNAHFATYSATKAALNQCIRTWKVEHPDRRFLRIMMGNAQPTEFVNQMGLERLGAALKIWGTQALPGGFMEPSDVGVSLASSFATMLDHPEIDVSEIQLDARQV